MCCKKYEERVREEKLDNRREREDGNRVCESEECRIRNERRNVLPDSVRNKE